MKKLSPYSLIVTLLSAVLSLAAGIFYKMQDGIFGQGYPEPCWSPVTFGLLIGCVVVVALLLICKLPGLASFVAATVPGVCLALFFIGINGARGAYWHLTRLPYEEKLYGIDPDFVVFVVLMVLAFIVGEMAVYARKTKKYVHT